MAKFRITGIDRDSGFETTIMIDAADRNAAHIEGVRRGIRDGVVSALGEGASSSAPPRLWLQVAIGVSLGLVVYSLIAGAASACAWAWMESRGAPSLPSAAVPITLPTVNPPNLEHYNATEFDWHIDATLIDVSWSATVRSDFDRPWECVPMFIFRADTGRVLGEQSGQPMVILPGITQISGRMILPYDAIQISEQRDIVLRPLHPDS